MPLILLTSTLPTVSNFARWNSYLSSFWWLQSPAFPRRRWRRGLTSTTGTSSAGVRRTPGQVMQPRRKLSKSAVVLVEGQEQCLHLALCLSTSLPTSCPSLSCHPTSMLAYPGLSTCMWAVDIWYSSWVVHFQGGEAPCNIFRRRLSTGTCRFSGQLVWTEVSAKKLLGRNLCFFRSDMYAQVGNLTCVLKHLGLLDSTGRVTQHLEKRNWGINIWFPGKLGLHHRAVLGQPGPLQHPCWQWSCFQGQCQQQDYWLLQYG